MVQARARTKAQRTVVGSVGRRCGWCGGYFVWVRRSAGEVAPQFCRPAHKKAAEKAAASIRDRVPPGTCTTPGKVAYATQQAAERDLGRLQVTHQGCHAYLCPCGRWHLGHPAATRGKATDPS